MGIPIWIKLLYVHFLVPYAALNGHLHRPGSRPYGCRPSVSSIYASRACILPVNSCSVQILDSAHLIRSNSRTEEGFRRRKHGWGINGFLDAYRESRGREQLGTGNWGVVFWVLSPSSLLKLPLIF